MGTSDFTALDKVCAAFTSETGEFDNDVAYEASAFLSRGVLHAYCVYVEAKYNELSEFAGTLNGLTDSDIQDFVTELRKFGITHFTVLMQRGPVYEFANVLWALQGFGCKLCGVSEVLQEKPQPQATLGLKVGL